MTNVGPVAALVREHDQTIALAPMVVPPHDNITLGYTDGALTSATYKMGSTVVATVTLAYDTSGNLVTVTRS